MLSLVKALILVSVLVIVFLPTGPRMPILSLLVFVFSMGLVYLYWRLSYWVSRSAALKTLADEGLAAKEDARTRFVGKVPSNPSEDLQRGRLVFSQSAVVLVQRNPRSEKGRPTYCISWSLPKDKVESLGFGKVAASRKGFIIYTGEEEVKFVSSRFCKHRGELFEAMGWNGKEI